VGGATDEFAEGFQIRLLIKLTIPIGRNGACLGVEIVAKGCGALFYYN